MHSEQQPPAVPPGISHQRYKCFTTQDQGDTAPDLRVGVWKGGREGTEAEGIACTTSPRLHLNHRTGGAPRLGSEPNPLLADAAPQRGISGQRGFSPRQESGTDPGAHNRQGGEPQTTAPAAMLPSPLPSALRGSVATTANGENRARKFRPKCHLLCSGKTGQPAPAAFLHFL